jgi:hypothetical protein
MPLAHSRTRRRLLGLAGGLFAASTLNWAPTSPSAAWVGALEAEAAPARQANTTDFVNFLRLVPDLPGTRGLVFVNDVERAMQLLGVSVPGPDADFDTGIKAYLDAVATSGIVTPPFISGLSQEAKKLWDIRDARGFDVRDVNQTVEAGLGTHTIATVRGRIDPAAVERAFSSCQECPTSDRPTYQGVSYFSWTKYNAPNLNRRYQPPFFDNSADGGLLLVQPELVHRTRETPLMEALIDSQRGAIPSLADAPDHALLAAGLTSLGAYSIMISNEMDHMTAAWTSRGGSQGWTSEEAFRAAVDPANLMRPFQTIGLGGALDDAGGKWATLAIAHANETHAAENVEILKRRIDTVDSQNWNKPLREIFSQVDLWAEGRVLLARLRHDMHRLFWYAIYLREDPLLIME